MFDRQLEHLAEHHRVLSLDDAVAELTAGTSDGWAAAPSSHEAPQHGADERRGVVITFDDGTVDFTDVVVPALDRHRLPATLFVATHFVDEQENFPWGAPPTSWSALRDSLTSGNVTIGSHTHAHWLLDRLDPDAITTDLDRSIELIGEHLAVDARHFAYPKARTRLAIGRDRRQATIRQRVARGEQGQPARPHRPPPALAHTDPTQRRLRHVHAEGRRRPPPRRRVAGAHGPRPLPGRGSMTRRSVIRRRVTRSEPRVVHITTTDMSLDWLLGPQLQAFAGAGYEVIGMSAAGPHVANLDAVGIRHVDVPAFTRSNNPLHDLRAFGQLLRLLHSLRPDIVHTHNPKPGILGRIAARLTRTPLVVNTQHGLWAQPTDRWQRRVPVYAAERIAAAFGDVELVQNPEDVETLVRTLHIPGAQGPPARQRGRPHPLRPRSGHGRRPHAIARRMGHRRRRGGLPGGRTPGS